MNIFVVDSEGNKTMKKVCDLTAADYDYLKKEHGYEGFSDEMLIHYLFNEE